MGTTGDVDAAAVELAAAQAAGLRALAGMIEAHPDLAPRLGFALRTITVPTGLVAAQEKRPLLVAFARAAQEAGATVTENVADRYLSVHLSWGAVVLEMFAAREDVCERVVTTTVPDPEALAQVPTVEVVEWRCAPLLADGRVA
jgi:hypothetical protein